MTFDDFVMLSPKKEQFDIENNCNVIEKVKYFDDRKYVIGNNIIGLRIE